MAQRLADLRSLALPGCSYKFHGGRGLTYSMELSPTPASRLYTCQLHVKPGTSPPELVVVHPDLKLLAEGKSIPHIYPHDGRGVKLCLWTPRKKEWTPSMQLSKTYIPWALQWLWYYEDWLASGEWAGGGEHPNAAHQRYGHRKL